MLTHPIRLGAKGELVSTPRHERHGPPPRPAPSQPSPPKQPHTQPREHQLVLPLDTSPSRTLDRPHRRRRNPKLRRQAGLRPTQPRPTRPPLRSRHLIVPQQFPPNLTYPMGAIISGGPRRTGRRKNENQSQKRQKRGKLAQGHVTNSRAPSIFNPRPHPPGLARVGGAVPTSPLGREATGLCYQCLTGPRP